MFYFYEICYFYNYQIPKENTTQCRVIFRIGRTMLTCQLPHKLTKCILVYFSLEDIESEQHNLINSVSKQLYTLCDCSFSNKAAKHILLLTKVLAILYKLISTDWQRTVPRTGEPSGPGNVSLCSINDVHKTKHDLWREENAAFTELTWTW